MKKLILTTLLIVAIQPVFGQHYYYSDNRQIPLLVDSTRVVVLFDDSMSFNYDQIIEEYPRIDTMFERSIYEGFRVAEISTGNNLDAFIDSLNQDSRISIANPFYIMRPTIPMLVGRTICCKFSENVGQSFIDSLNMAYDVEIVEEDQYSGNLFLLRVKKHPSLTPLEISNIYYELGETVFCQPNFLGGFEFDDYFIYDHTGKNSGQCIVFLKHLPTPRVTRHLK
jgi:hypothetical protein